jgi:hypothetical protein
MEGKSLANLRNSLFDPLHFMHTSTCMITITSRRCSRANGKCSKKTDLLSKIKEWNVVFIASCLLAAESNGIGWLGCR